MKYENVEKAVFLERPNRFIAHVMRGGEPEICHVKNTGRCRELLIPGVTVFIQRCDQPARKTKYDLIGVKKGDMMINMDSQAPNKAVHEWILNSGFFEDISYVKPEMKYGSSRFDFYIEAGNRKIFMEVKGVTLEEDGVARFPDAPTLRGLKHIRELIECKKEGWEGYIFFLIQMKPIRLFRPNDDTQPEFGQALAEAQDAGVGILAYDSIVTEDSIRIGDPIQILI